MAPRKKAPARKARDAHGMAVSLATTRKFPADEQDPRHVAQRRGKPESGAMGKTSASAKSKR